MLSAISTRGQTSSRLEQINAPCRDVRWCARRQDQVHEDSYDHSRIFDGGDDLQTPATVRAMFDVDVKDPFGQTRPTGARRRAGRVFYSMSAATTVRPRHDRGEFMQRRRCDVNPVVSNRGSCRMMAAPDRCIAVTELRSRRGRITGGRDARFGSQDEDEV